jgi:ketosteroid isomerase-like protein
MTKFALALLFGSAVAGFTLPVSAQAPAAKPAPAAPAMMKPAAAPVGPAPVAAPPPAAPAAPAAQGPDMTKVGPMSRKVTKEDKKGVSDAYKAWDEAWKKGDVNALADLVEFPLLMMSDNSKGEEKHFEATREQFVGMMQGMVNMPKDLKMTDKHTPTFISDSLVVAIGNMTMTMGKVKGSWHGFDVLTLKDGKWKFRQICEAGWGDMVPNEHSMAAEHTMAPKHETAPMMAPKHETAPTMAHPAAAPTTPPAKK